MPDPGVRNVRPPRGGVPARVPVVTCILLAIGLSCGPAGGTTAPTSGSPDPGNASYGVGYDPAILVSHDTCDRYFAGAALSLGRRGQTFGLSANLMDDCTPLGRGWSYWGILIPGHYAIVDTIITFTPDDPHMPPFVGTFDSLYVNLTIPERPDSLAPVPIPLRLGPKQPF